MKKNLTIIMFQFLTVIMYGQNVSSGEYEFGLKLAYDNKSNKITGYFENYTGWNEETKNPRFSCIFYIEGVLSGTKSIIRTYYPTDKKEDNIIGTIEVINNTTIAISLSNEHGGCGNVQHFVDESPEFQLEKNKKWIQIRYINTEKSSFFGEKSMNKKLKSYLVLGDIVCVEKIEDDWVFCTYYGKKKTSGWISVKDLNEI